VNSLRIIPSELGERAATVGLVNLVVGRVLAVVGRVLAPEAIDGALALDRGPIGVPTGKSSYPPGSFRA